MTKKRGIHCYISGKVQGVFFRQATKDCAQQYSITGWVRNLTDGRVEVTAYGNEEAISQFEQWLKIGPPAAQVIEVQCEEVLWENLDDFSVI